MAQQGLAQPGISAQKQPVLGGYQGCGPTLSAELQTAQDKRGRQVSLAQRIEGFKVLFEHHILLAPS